MRAISYHLYLEGLQNTIGQKRDHEQWDIVGKFLFELAIRNAEGDFCKMAIEKLNRSIKV